jgi:hypothetical protein
MKKYHVMRLIQVLVLVFASSLLFVGCEDEDSPDTGGLDDWFRRNPYVSDPRTTSLRDISITPASVTITFAGQAVNFRASGGQGEYKWDVADPSAGTITRLASTFEAVYTASAVAPNSVVAFDTRGQAGIGEVVAQSSPLVAVAVPDTITQPGGRAILTATGGTPPYTWTVADIALGSIDGPSVGNSVVYKASTVGSGDNTVRCADSAGNTVNVLIMQP